MKGLKERLLYFIEYKGLPVQMFEKIVGLSNAAVSKMGDNTRRSTIDKISKSFPELDVNWLLTGQGEMLSYGQDTESISNKVQEPTSHYGRKELNEGNGFTTYLLPMSAMGGTLTGFAAPGAMLQNCEAIISPIEDVDFAITVYGDFGDGEGYVTRTGYLINPDNVEIHDTYISYNGVRKEPEIIIEHLITIEENETKRTSNQSQYIG